MAPRHDDEPPRPVGHGAAVREEVEDAEGHLPGVVQELGRESERGVGVG